MNLYTVSRILVAVVLLNHSPAFAQATLRANCEDLKGIRVDYSNEKFEQSTDGMTGSKPQILYDFNTKKATYISTDASKTTDNVEIVLVSETDRRLSFVGVINGAPVMLSIYPKDKILFYSEQASMVLPNMAWPKAKLFWAKCEIQTNEK